MLNQEGILQLKFDMRSNYKSYSQNCWGSNTMTNGQCGTVQCMAGYCYLRKYGVDSFINDMRGNYDMFANKALGAGIEQLGIQSTDEIPIIFSGWTTWPKDLRDRYSGANLKRDLAERVEVACEALDRLNQDGSIMSLQQYEQEAKKEVEYA